MKTRAQIESKLETAINLADMLLDAAAEEGRSLTKQERRQLRRYQERIATLQWVLSTDN